MKLFLIVATLINVVQSSSYAAELPPGVVKLAPGISGIAIPQTMIDNGVPRLDAVMVPYTVKLSDKVSFEMIPIPGGKFKLGSPASEKGRNADEGPQVEVEVGPLWVGKCEVTWGEYALYMTYEKLFQTPDGKRAIKLMPDKMVDAVTAPSSLYEPNYHMEYGEHPKLPAVTMTQFAARQYTKWLSQKTGQTFRLPNEIEWEYAARAGTTTAYSYGDDAKQGLGHMMTEANADARPGRVGSLKPNAWGLHDMHGNVMEWTLDGYDKDRYAALAKLPTRRGLDATNWPDKLFPRVLRGGSFEHAPAFARSAARLPSNDEHWQDTDPNRHKSPWWFTDDPSRAIGFRVVRQLEPLTAEQAKRCYEIDNSVTQNAVDEYIDQGRGGRGIAGKDAESPQSDPKKAP